MSMNAIKNTFFPTVDVEIGQVRAAADMKEV